MHATKLINLLHLPAFLHKFQQTYPFSFRSMGGRVVMVDDKFCFEEETQLTVHKTSVFYRGDGFVVYDPKGEVMLRFDSYYGPESQPKDELVLMDATGKCLLTLIRKKPSLHQRWEGLLGEKMGNQSPIFCVRRSSIIGRSNVLVDVYGDPGEEYQIDGSYPQRCCTIYNTSLKSSSKELMVEIKRKVDPSTNVMLGKDVFLLCLRPGFDGAFAMALVLILDQMFDDGDVDDNYENADPGHVVEDSSS